LTPLEALLEEAISQNLCTGAAGAVVVEGKTLWSYCSGKTGEEETPLQEGEGIEVLARTSPPPLPSRRASMRHR
jgi:hypothetical protein